MSLYQRALLPLQSSELYVHLQVVARNLLLVAVRVHGAASDAIGEAVEAGPLADPIDGSVGCLDVVVALQVSDNAYRSHEVGPTQVRDLFTPLSRAFCSEGCGGHISAPQPLVAQAIHALETGTDGFLIDLDITGGTSSGNDGGQTVIDEAQSVLPTAT